MTHKIIKTDNYLLVVDDSEIKVGDYFYSIRGIVEQAVIDYPKNEHHGVIIAHLPINGSPILEGVDLLPPIEDNVEDLAKDIYPQPNPYQVGLSIGADMKKEAFIVGYNKAREKYNYTEWDIRQAIDMARLHGPESFLVKYREEEIIQSLHQYPTEFESEMVGVIEHKDGLVTNQYEIPKTITTAQGVQWVGKYK